MIFLILSPIGSALIPNQIPELPQFDDKTYLGFEYGSAGISTALLEALSSSLIDNETKNLILNLVKNTLEKLWENRIEFEGVKYPVWDRSIEEQFLSVYPGTKYGSSGIILAFIKMYEVTSNFLWLKRAEESYWYLSSQAINASTNPHWPYHYSMPKEDEGIAITDLKYGSTGILNTALALYRITKNETYLVHGELIVTWLSQISIDLYEDDLEYKIVPWYYIDDTTNSELPFYTTYGYGISGIASKIYEFGIYSQFDNYLQWGFELGNFLEAIQLDDGSWYTASDRQSEINVGFDNGVTGIIYGLHQLNLLSNSSHFENAIRKGITWLFSRYFSNSSHVGFVDLVNINSEMKITNSLYDGNIGILRTLNLLSSYLTEDQIDLLILAYKFIITSGSFYIVNGREEMLFLQESAVSTSKVDFSFAQGLAGFLSEMVNQEFKELILPKISLNISRIIIAAINTFEYFQQLNGHWQRQYLIPTNWNLRHFTISDFDSDDIPNNTVTIQSENDNIVDEKGYFQENYIMLSLIVLLPMIYVFRKKNLKG